MEFKTGMLMKVSQDGGSRRECLLLNWVSTSSGTYLKELKRKQTTKFKEKGVIEREILVQTVTVESKVL